MIQHNEKKTCLASRGQTQGSASATRIALSIRPCGYAHLKYIFVILLNVMHLKLENIVFYSAELDSPAYF